MKILFSMRHAGALRNFASTVEELARRGHRVHLAFMMRDKLNDPRILRELTAAYPRITYDDPPATVPTRLWLGLARAVRSTADYLRYLTPEYAGATALHDRAARMVSPAVKRLVKLPGVGSGAGRACLSGILRLIERAVPADPWAVSLVTKQSPDVLLVTPMVELGSDQVEFVKAARALGVPSGLLVHSWDNLTNKGLIHAVPDRVFVWNDAQRREAEQMHRVPARQVVVTGAPVYDQWFVRRPGTTRDEFCAKVGIPADRPFFLYLCSSQFIAPHEGDFVRSWIEALRAAADERVRTASVVVRLHPRTDLKRWKRFDITQFANAAIWPGEGANPVDADSRRDYFDSLFHAAAAVGINTSAQIEAGIVGRPVYSIRVPEYETTQEGTLHFHYLVKEGGGLLHLADTLEQHTQALAAALDRREETAARVRTFVHQFVRPAGLGVAATPLLADAIEQLGALRIEAPRREPMWLQAIRLALYPVATRMALR
jgi:hypothetical protein